MKSLSDNIEEIIQNNSLLEDGLYNGYINITGLSLYIMPMLKRKMGKSPSLDSVKMSLSRVSKRIESPKKSVPFTSKNIFIRKWLNIIFFRYSKSVESGLKNISKVESKYLTKINGNKEASIIFDNFYTQKIEENFNMKKATLKKSGLILVWIDIKDSIVDKPWLLYKISKWLFFYWIKVVEVLQTHNELSVIVREEDLKNTVDVICSI